MIGCGRYVVVHSAAVESAAWKGRKIEESSGERECAEWVGDEMDEELVVARDDRRKGCFNSSRPLHVSAASSPLSYSNSTLCSELSASSPSSPIALAEDTDELLGDAVDASSSSPASRAARR